MPVAKNILRDSNNQPEPPGGLPFEFLVRRAPPTDVIEADAALVKMCFGADVSIAGAKIRYSGPDDPVAIEEVKKYFRMMYGGY